MTTPQPPDLDELARSAVALALARARQPGANSRQQPSRREQMLNAAVYAAQRLEEAAEHVPEPRELLLAAEGVRVAALRLATPKERRQAQRLPRPGRITEAGRDVTLEDVTQAATLARAIAQTAHLDRREQP